MLQRMSMLFARTLREDPADAEVPSHRLLVRAGYLRPAAPGLYTWLPLGLRVLDRISAVVRAELAGAGGQEVRFPALLPVGPDRAYRPATSYQELLAGLARAEVSSYRELPLALFAVQAAHREEGRARAGLLGGREVVVAQACSFDLDGAGLASAHAAHRQAFERVLERVGLAGRVVAGGPDREVVMAPAEVGEDAFAACADCGYAASTEAVQVGARPAAPNGAVGPVEVLQTPDTPTIETLCALLGVPASATLKNLLVRVGGALVAVGVPGDREVDLARLAAIVAPATVEIATEQDFAARPDLVRGYVGPQGLPADVPYWADPAVAPGTAWVTGANAPGRHARNVVAGRDFAVDEYRPVAAVRAGDPCPRCGAGLAVDRGIRLGHLAALGDAFGLDALGPQGAPVRLAAGSYGLEVSRLVAAVAEQHHDAAGLAWPPAVAPYHVHVVGVGSGGQPAVAGELARTLAGAGHDVLLDDRPGLSAGVRLTDAELLGMPVAVVVGRRAAEGVVELRDRRTGGRDEVPLSSVLDAVRGLVGAEPPVR